MDKSKLVPAIIMLCLIATVLLIPALAQEDPGGLTTLQGDDDEIFGQEIAASRFALQSDDAEIYVRDSLPISPLTTLQGDDREIYTIENPLFHLQGDDSEAYAVGAVVVAWADLQGDDTAVFTTAPVEILAENLDTILLASLPAANLSALDVLPNSTGSDLPDMTSVTENKIAIDNIFLIIGGGFVLLLIGIAIGNPLFAGSSVSTSKATK
jgi:hypothetical protein